MIGVLSAVAPVFGLLVVGQILFRVHIFSDEFWQQSARLVYWVLMPSLLFWKLGSARFEGELILPYAAALAGAFVLVVAGVRMAGAALSLPRPVTSSVLQGAARHNTFIALAIAERIFGQAGLALASLAAAILVLVTNMSITPMMVELSRSDRDMNIGRAILRDLYRNPILIAVFSGLAVNALPAPPFALAFDLTRLLGSAALPLMLLCVGASLRFETFRLSPGPLMLATVSKLIVFPLAVIALASIAGLSGVQALVLVIFAAVPTAASSQALARELGGDVPLMVNVVTLQTALSFLTLPLTLLLAEGWFPLPPQF
ncbi:AEC family transporter [Defluviimonas sp. SAOS-178_SWC]|uniref:AEC family transporter n=1 Tax=Defluviimonas sp. SAOS-178_SWC TaxID=3121287 RepID=UPI003222218F